VTAAQQCASERNWTKAQLFSVRAALQRSLHVIRPDLQHDMHSIMLKLDALIEAEWPEWKLDRMFSWTPLPAVAEKRRRCDCLRILKAHGYVWNPKSLPTIRRAAAFLEGEVR
jgi:hypothetical protein